MNQKTAKPKPEQYQSVRITLADGRAGWFTGKAFLDENKDKGKATVVKFEFTEPKPLPPGRAFEQLP